MRLHEIYPFAEERKKRKRIGRGVGSGRGGTSTKGHKGQNARAGGGVRAGFEGGQTPLQRRLPKTGFNNALFKKEYAILNIKDLVAYFPEATAITIDDIYNRGICKAKTLVKILGDGTLEKALQVQAHAFSKKAEEIITVSGGKIEKLGE